MTSFLDDPKKRSRILDTPIQNDPRLFGFTLSEYRTERFDPQDTRIPTLLPERSAEEAVAQLLKRGLSRAFRATDNASFFQLKLTGRFRKTTVLLQGLSTSRIVGAWVMLTSD